MSQLAFEWRQKPSYAPEDFIVSYSNAKAVRFLDSWPDGGSAYALLSGEAASGRTHLAHCWLARMNGGWLDASLLGKVPSEQIWPENTPTVLEDIHTVTDETALFHLLRYVETTGKILLLTANIPAKHLPFVLPDLRSRLLALPAVAIEPPDETLLRMFIIKCFSDRQLRIPDEVVEYIIKRVERSFSAVCSIIEKIEKASLETKREITVPLVKKVFEQ